MNLGLLKKLCCLFSLRAIFCKMSWFSAYKVDFGSLSSELLFLRNLHFFFLKNLFFACGVHSHVREKKHVTETHNNFSVYWDDYTLCRLKWIFYCKDRCFHGILQQFAHISEIFYWLIMNLICCWWMLYEL